MLPIKDKPISWIKKVKQIQAEKTLEKLYPSISRIEKNPANKRLKVQVALLPLVEALLKERRVTPMEVSTKEWYKLLLQFAQVKNRPIFIL